jgi:hypothetical protein
MMSETSDIPRSGEMPRKFEKKIESHADHRKEKNELCFKNGVSNIAKS